MRFSILFLCSFLPLFAQLTPKQDAHKNHGGANETDGRNKKLTGDAPEQDPELAKYYINLKTSPRPGKADPVETTLPLILEKGDRIAFIGNLLLDAERRYGHLETLLHQQHPKHELTVRNLAWPADEIDLMPRPDNFGDLDQHLHYFKADVIIAAYGFNESFAGEERLPAFKERLDKFLNHLKSHAYNGKTAPKIVLLSPSANENQDVKDFPRSAVKAAKMNNERLRKYSKAISQVASANKVAFVDVLGPTNWHAFGTGGDFTFDGHQLNATGHRVFSEAVFRNLVRKDPTVINEDLRNLVVDKATQFFYRYRPLNTFYYTGGRNKSYGYLDFLPAMRNFDLMVANRDRAIHETVATGKLAAVDDSNLPQLDDVLLSRGANKFLSVAEEQAAFKVD
ncbi:SGNH/GDSL hydrolase family protein, partial [Akkermansiaceae bacterium]|nr:SGNH/GDSL hydrolase family protein [Akkermansiaceae bacterium]